MEDKDREDRVMNQLRPITIIIHGNDRDHVLMIVESKPLVAHVEYKSQVILLVLLSFLQL